MIHNKSHMNTQANIFESPNLTVAELAISHPSAMTVFTKYNIDYCCGGNRSLEDACIRVGLNPEKIKQEIMNSPAQQSSVPPRVEQWSASLLADYIVQNHHAYVKNVIPEIEALLEKVCRAHGDDNIELLTIRQDFADLAEELLNHMIKEEAALFPAIKRLTSQTEANPLLADSLQTPINVMEQEHTVAGDLMKSIRKASDNYTVPEYACPTYRATYQRLREFDEDLMTHVHLENNVLFRKVAAVSGK